MKLIFLDNNQNIKKHEIESQDLKQLFQIADKLSDNELEKLKTVIDKLPKLLNTKKL